MVGLLPLTDAVRCLQQQFNERHFERATIPSAYLARISSRIIYIDIGSG